MERLTTSAVTAGTAVVGLPFYMTNRAVELALILYDASKDINVMSYVREHDMYMLLIYDIAQY